MTTSQTTRSGCSRSIWAMASLPEAADTTSSCLATSARSTTLRTLSAIVDDEHLCHDLGPPFRGALGGGRFVWSRTPRGPRRSPRRCGGGAGPRCDGWCAGSLTALLAGQRREAEVAAALRLGGADEIGEGLARRSRRRTRRGRAARPRTPARPGPAASSRASRPVLPPMAMAWVSAGRSITSSEPRITCGAGSGGRGRPGAGAARKRIRGPAGRGPRRGSATTLTCPVREPVHAGLRRLAGDVPLKPGQEEERDVPRLGIAPHDAEQLAAVHVVDPGLGDDDVRDDPTRAGSGRTSRSPRRTPRSRLPSARARTRRGCPARDQPARP